MQIKIPNIFNELGGLLIVYFFISIIIDFFCCVAASCDSAKKARYNERYADVNEIADFIIDGLQKDDIVEVCNGNSWTLKRPSKNKALAFNYIFKDTINANWYTISDEKFLKTKEYTGGKTFTFINCLTQVRYDNGVPLSPESKNYYISTIDFLRKQ